MLDVNSYSADRFAQGLRIRRRVVFSLFIAMVLLVFGTMAAILFFAPHVNHLAVWLVGLTIFLTVAVPFAISYEPRYGVYLLFGSAILFAGDPAKMIPTMPSSAVPFWWNVSIAFHTFANSNALDMLVFSPAEVIFLITGLSWIIRGVANRDLKIRTGPIGLAVLGYLVVICWGFFYGQIRGGDTVIALWHVRSQVLFVFAFILGANLIRTPEHVKHLIWIVAITVAIQGVFGAATFVARGGKVSMEGFGVHDVSLFYNLLFFIMIIAGLTRIDKRLTIFSAIFSAPALIAVMANQRRAGIGAFAIAFLPLLPLLAVVWTERKRQIVTFALTFSIASILFLGATWNTSGPWALPARALQSYSNPTDRDAQSNNYRDLEDRNLKFTRDLFPWTGLGFGHRFVEVAPMPEIFFPLKDYFPHNSLLWVWYSVGHIGFWLFLMMVAVALIKGVHHCRAVQDPWVRFIGVIAVLDLLMVMVYGKYDLQLVNGRQMTLLAVLIGIVSVLPQIDRAGRQEAGAAEEVTEDPARLEQIPVGR